MPAPYRKKAEEAKGICKFFQKGKCSNKRCPYLHVKGEKSDPDANSTASNLLLAMLKLFFEKQRPCIYLPNNGTLNLRGMSTYEDLQSISSSINFNAKTFCVTLCQCVKEVLAPLPLAYILDENGIKSIAPFCEALRLTGLDHCISAISFARNELETTDIARHLSNLSQLKEVNFEGNPVTADPNYKGELKACIPSLTSIDREAARCPALNLPWPRFIGDGPTDYSYSPLQSNILEFIKSCVVAPMEKGRDIERVGSAYAAEAIMSFSCESASAVSTTGSSTAPLQRDLVREIVAFRLRQNSTNHNLALAKRFNAIAIGKSDVCSMLEECVYPPHFSVSHFVHPSVNVTVMDNHQDVDSVPCVAIMPEPISLVTLHGVLEWAFEPSMTTLASNFVIRRRFARSLVITTSCSGGWHVTNDTLSLFPFDNVVTSSGKPLELSHLLYMPSVDELLVLRFSRLFSVPEVVVATLANVSSSDAQLASILMDLSYIPLEMYQHAATLMNGDPIGSIMCCRLQKVYGIDEQGCIALIQKCGLHWEALQAAILQ